MEQRNLGISGLKVSLVGLGCNNFGPRIDLDQTQAVVDRAIDSGITLFDTADGYGRGTSEEFLGKALGSRRREVVIATKFGFPMSDDGKLQGASRRYIMNAVEMSLRRLNTDWIDLYQLHLPDPLTPIEETLRTLDDLVSQGKVRYIGCSNLAPWQIVEAQWTARSNHYASFVSCQDEYSLITRAIEKEKQEVMQAYGLGLLPYYPLAAGILTGKYKRNAPMPEGARLTNNEKAARRYMTEANLLLAEKLEAFAMARGHTLVELAFSWLASRPFVSSIIAGATRPEQVEQNVTSASWNLSAEEIEEIAGILDAAEG
ncbi:MAG: aldo/keto reductase [Nitratireductor sp.]|nr:aldo/keto reductase [Nitratireductor sp.]